MSQISPDTLEACREVVAMLTLLDDDDMNAADEFLGDVEPDVYGAMFGSALGLLSQALEQLATERDMTYLDVVQGLALHFADGRPL